MVFCQEKPCNPSVFKTALNQLDEGAEFLTDFHTYLEDGENGEIPKSKYSMVLTENTIYQYSIAYSLEYPGRAVFELYDGDLLLGTTYAKASDTLHESFYFKCQKSAIYHMAIYFLDGEEGCAVGILAFKEKF